MLNDHLEDIALFFNQNGQPRKRWVTKDVYMARRVETVDPGWLRTVVADGGNANNPYYVANLSKLSPPGVSPEPDGKKKKTRTAPPVSGPQDLGQGDLVVIPFATPDVAYVVKQSEYQDPTVCKDITEIEGADLTFLAVTEGVVLANIPKEDITGMSCYLLNLRNLTSGAKTKSGANT